MRNPSPSKPRLLSPPRRGELVFGAIDVGTNAMRLELARPRGDGSGGYEVLHQERDPVRPGEGVFKNGSLRRDVADRVIATLRRYGQLCHRFGAVTRAVATSAVREAKNRDEIVRRARREASVELEVISGQEEARLICLGVLDELPASARSLVIDIGGGSTEIARAQGSQPSELFSLELGAVRLTELFDASGKIDSEKLSLMRAYVRQVLEERLPRDSARGTTRVFGSSGTIRSVVMFGADGPEASARQLARAVDELASMPPDRRRKRFDQHRADIVVAGAVILEGIVQRLRLPQVTTVDRGLRDGLIIDLLRGGHDAGDHLPADAALAYLRRFDSDERHARQVARLALTLFDGLAALHKLPAAARPLLEVAALLHDVGSAVSYHRHHKHSYYIIQNAELPGLTSRDREIVARLARFHRRTPPAPGHQDLVGLSGGEVRMVVKLAAILSLADAFDRSHHQPVLNLRIRSNGRVVIELLSRQPLDLEVWDARQELALMRSALGKPVDVVAAKPAARGLRLV